MYLSIIIIPLITSISNYTQFQLRNYHGSYRVYSEKGKDKDNLFYLNSRYFKTNSPSNFFLNFYTGYFDILILKEGGLEGQFYKFNIKFNFFKDKFFIFLSFYK